MQRHGIELMVNEEDVRRVALSLPEVTQNPKGFGFSVHDKAFAWSYMERVDPKKARVGRPDVLAVRVADENEKQFLLIADPEKFFTVPHYDGFPAVLVRLEKIEADQLEELLIEAWRSKAPRTLVAAFDERRGER
jgi:hypothetical protein